MFELPGGLGLLLLALIVSIVRDPRTMRTALLLLAVVMSLLLTLACLITAVVEQAVDTLAAAWVLLGLLVPTPGCGRSYDAASSMGMTHPLTRSPPRAIIMTQSLA